MGEVGEQAEPQFFQLRFLLFHGTQSLLPDPVAQQQDQYRQQGQVAEVGEAGPVPGGLDAQVDAALGEVLGRIREIGLHFEAVAAGRHIRIGGHAQARGDDFPVGVEADQAVGIDQALRIGVLRDGEFEREEVRAARYLDPGGLGDMLINQIVAACGRVVGHFPVQHVQACEGDLGHLVAAAVHQQRGEVGDAAETAEIELARGGLESGPGTEFIALQAIIGAETVDLAAARRQA